MSRLSALQGKPKKYKIGELELELKPLTVEELEIFSVDQDAPMEKQMESSKKMIARVLKKSVPDTTDEEINSVSLEHLETLMNAIMDLHNMGKGSSQVDKIKQMQQNVKAARDKEQGS